MNEHALTIEVYSDVICPWCYVGKRRLERALQQGSGRVNVEVIWRPFQLNPTMPREGMDRLNQAYGISGAQPADVLAAAIEKSGCKRVEHR